MATARYMAERAHTRGMRARAALARGSMRRALAPVVLILILALFSTGALAARIINWVTLDGGAAVTVAPGASITVNINVTTTGNGVNDDWRCTRWRVATTPPGSSTAANHANNNSSGNHTETFTISAPLTAGVYNAYFIAYRNDACSQSASATHTVANAITVGVPPTVVSINRASADPASPGTAVSWTVTFSENVTGVNAGDFSLVPGGSVSGASITSVSGGGATWTVTANTGSGGGTLGLDLDDDDSIVDAGGMPLGGSGAGNGDATGQAYTITVPFTCTPPANTPAGLSLSCVCDTFGRASLNPSTIFGSNWTVSTSDNTGILPSIVNPGYLRLTNNTGDNAKAATVPGIFPAAGNYISVEFKHYAYNSTAPGNIGNCSANTGADGIAVTLSDYAVPAVPGAYGGSLGYAQKPGIPGFSGGWLGVAMDEWGNYQNPTEARNGGPGPRCQSVGARGSGSGSTGYPWIGGTGTLLPRIDNYTSVVPAPGHFYQVIVDARNAGNPTPQTFVSVNRDTSGSGSVYSSVLAPFDVYATNPAQAAVPDNWQISFTGSTGGANNIHEIGALRICAQTMWPPSGGTASGFNAIDSAYGNPPGIPVQNYLTGHIYTKLMGTPFRLNVAAIHNNQIQTAYVVSGSKYVQLKMVDNADGACVIDSSQPDYCNSTCVARPAVPGGSQTLTFTSSNQGQKQSGDFTLNTAYRRLVAIMRECTTSACTAFTPAAPACSTDAFAVRPLAVSSLVSSNATNTGTGGAPTFRAGSDAFSLTATVAGIAGHPNGYTGVLKINPAATQAVAPATVAGALTSTFPAATSATPTASATGNAFRYSEVGHFRFLGYNPATNTTSARGVFDGVMSATECAGLTAPQCDALRAATWTGVDGISSRADCIASSFANTPDTTGTFASNPNYGKVGCNFGLYNASGAGSPNSPAFGRFIPDHFTITTARLKPRQDIAACYAAAPAGTTGTVAAASNQLTVASLAGFGVGDLVTVFGAGVSGSPLVAAINAIAGNVLTLSASAATAATNAPVFEVGAETGSIVTGTSVLTLANGGGIATGDTLVVFGAGPGGSDLVAQVAALAGNVATLSDTADTTVSGTPVFQRRGFTYMDEPMRLDLSLEARNGADGRTLNYAGSLSKLDASSPTGSGANAWGLWGVVNNAYGVAGCRALFDGSGNNETRYSAGCAGLPATVPAAPYAAPVPRVGASNTAAVTWTAGAAALSTDVTLGRALVPDGAFDMNNGFLALGVWPRDADGVTPPVAARNLDADDTAGAERVAVGAADVRFGRLRIANAHGSALLKLPLPALLEYWTLGRGGFVTNSADMCTTLATGDFSLDQWRNNLELGETLVEGVGFASGTGSVTLAQPSGGDNLYNGSVRLGVDLSAAGRGYLQGCWTAAPCEDGYDQNPTGWGSFGSHKKASEFIFIRENY